MANKTLIMTEFKLIIENSKGESVTQMITNEKEVGEELFEELDSYLFNYIIKFNEVNVESGVTLSKLQVYIDDYEIRNITYNSHI